MSLEIQNGAIFVADVHYSSKRDAFLGFLQDLKFGKIQTNQLFLMGDIFDLLIGNIKQTISNNQKCIDLINEISQKMQVIYLEGNHDFLLKKLFPNVLVFPYGFQPLLFSANSKSVLLSHGDFGFSLKYEIFTFIFRSKLFLFSLDLLSLNRFNSKYINKKISHLNTKNICTKIKNFAQIAKGRVKKYARNADFFVEGHYHQGLEEKFFDTTYINLESFACTKSYYVVEFASFSVFFAKKTF